MRTRFTWIAGTLALIAVGVLVACSAKYSASNNGLIVVTTQADRVMETFSLDLGNGSVSQINNVNGPPTVGTPTAVVLDPAGAYAYVIVQQNTTPGSANGIARFQMASDGKLSANIGTVPVTNPVAMIMDSAGKFLFVVQGTEGTVAVFSVGSNASLTEVTGSPFALPQAPGGQSPTASALAITPTVFPTLGTLSTPCAALTAPATENLYVTDSLNNVVLNYSVSSTGALKLVPATTLTPGVATGTTPSGVTVDACNRFLYVSNQAPNNSVSAFTICYAVALPNCPSANYSLQPVVGAPTTGYPVADAPGALLVNPLGQFLYVLNTGSGEISAFRIGSETGGLSPLTPATVAVGSYPTALAIRSDDLWLFVTNQNSATVSQFAITPATGTLTPLTAFETDNNPTGVAVK
jgi:6-phosphogluconolactonase (cycloisomerase 2 family)